MEDSRTEKDEEEREKVCKRCKRIYLPSSNTPSSCRFHPSFFVCRRHDDQKRSLSADNQVGRYPKMFNIVVVVHFQTKDKSKLSIFGAPGHIMAVTKVWNMDWRAYCVARGICRRVGLGTQFRVGSVENGKRRKTVWVAKGPGSWPTGGWGVWLIDYQPLHWLEMVLIAKSLGGKVTLGVVFILNRAHSSSSWASITDLCLVGNRPFVASARYYELGPDDPPYAAKFYDCCGAEDPEAPGCTSDYHISYDDE
ncbi:hypothetical protein Cgig2_017782 [Carnegiea gigantea]|uniref:Uncharacterized protein n=1 Tax=Carnegiea gigantea TaxID=171969 RepID=A0A9Q1KUZ0_9CARY|nr:hypothetical protein Cgig2_017782 [Carnegiea gigantea]